jgi:hypothetical protein
MRPFFIKRRGIIDNYLSSKLPKVFKKNRSLILTPSLNLLTYF